MIYSSDLLSQSDFEVRYVSPHIDRALLDEKPHRHPFHEIIYIKSGHGKHTIDGEVFELQENTIYVIGEGQVHDFLEGENLKGYLLRYKLSVLPPALTIFATDYSILQLLSDSNSIQLTKEDVEDFDQNFESLLKESQKKSNDKRNYIFHFILLTLLSHRNPKP